MRITDSLRAGGLLQNIQTSLDNLNTVQQEISTGKKLTDPSDDPAGTSQAIALRASLLNDTQYKADADQAKTVLSTADGALSSVNNILDSVRQIAVQGANSTESQDSLNALATQVDGAIQQIVSLANTDINGKYVFGGTKTQTPPFTGTPPAYQGDEGALVANIGPNQTLTLNTPGGNQSLFSGTFTALTALSTHLRAGDYAAVSGDIAGVDAGITAAGTARAAIGDKTNVATDVKQRLDRIDNEYTDSLSGIENVDLAQAYVQLQSAQNVYQASLVTVSKAYGHSLADYL